MGIYTTKHDANYKATCAASARVDATYARGGVPVEPDKRRDGVAAGVVWGESSTPSTEATVEVRW